MRVNLFKQRYLRYFGPFPLRGRGFVVINRNGVVDIYPVKKRRIKSSFGDVVDSVFNFYDLHPELL